MHTSTRPWMSRRSPAGSQQLNRPETDSEVVRYHCVRQCKAGCIDFFMPCSHLPPRDKRTHCLPWGLPIACQTPLSRPAPLTREAIMPPSRVVVTGSCIGHRSCHRRAVDRARIPSISLDVKKPTAQSPSTRAAICRPRFYRRRPLAHRSAVSALLNIRRRAGHRSGREKLCASICWACGTD